MLRISHSELTWERETGITGLLRRMGSIYALDIQNSRIRGIRQNPIAKDQKLSGLLRISFCSLQTASHRVCLPRRPS